MAVDAVLNWLWQGGVVAIVAAGLLQRLDRARAAIRCLMCWTALIVVVLLPLVSLAFAAASPAEPTMSARAAFVTVPVAWWTSSALLVGAWAIWVAIYAVRLGGALVIMTRARARCRPFPPAVASTLAHWQRIGQTGRRAHLVLSDRASAASVFGCGAPIIAVAPTVVGRLDADELDRIVIHEWAHVQRRDDLANIARLLVRTVAGWHPAVWWLDRRLSIEQELACDETVVAVTGGSKFYASCLVKLASLRAAHGDALLASGALSSSGLTRRVARLLVRREFTSSAWGRGTAALGAAVLAALAVGVAPVRAVQAAVSATVARVLQPIATAAPAPIQAGAASRTGDRLAAPRRIAETRAVSPNPQPETVHFPGAADMQPAPEERTVAAIEVALPAVAVTVLDTAAKAEPTDPLLVSLPSPVPVASPPAVDTARSPWSSAADAGVAIGNGSKRAGVATAGAFTRFAKKIAGSF
jgi:beta-lactamase regulating signal transducer with metallopeptidase domain